MRSNSKKLFALVLSMAILASCMVFSFSSNAATTLKGNNNFNDQTAGWYSKYGTGTTKSAFNSNISSDSADRLLYFVPRYDEATQNGYMAYGARSATGSVYPAAFMVVDDGATAAFKPGVGNYAIKFDYMLPATAQMAQDIEIYVVNHHTDYVTWSSAFNRGASDSTKNDLAGWENNGRLTKRLVATVNPSEAGKGWQTVSACFELPNKNWATSIMMLPKSSSVTNAKYEGSELYIDNIEIYSYTDEATDLPSVTVMHDGAVVNTSYGLAGARYTMPDLSSVTVPTGYVLAYFADEACTEPTTAPAAFTAESQTVYVKPVLQATWENAFDNGTSSNWKSNYTVKDGDTDTNWNIVNTKNYAYLQTETDGNTAMAVGFGEGHAAAVTSGFTMLHQSTTSGTNELLPGNKGNYSGSTAGLFAPKAGKYIVSIDYKVSKFSDTAKAKIDIYAASYEWYWKNSAERKLWQMQNFVNNGTAAMVKVCTVSASDLGSDWSTAVAYLDVTTSHAASYLSFFADSNGADVAGSEVLIDNIKVVRVTDEIPDQSKAARTHYLYRANIGTETQPILTHLHSHATDKDDTKAYTSIRLGAKYTAGDINGDTIILNGHEYALVERGIVAGTADMSLNPAGEKGTAYLWKSKKTAGFDQYWESNPENPTEITYTLRLANMSEAWFAETYTKEFCYRAYYKIKVPYATADGAAAVSTITVYGGTSKAFTFKKLLDTYINDPDLEKGYWFDGNILGETNS